jgi:hypothetical protein
MTYMSQTWQERRSGGKHGKRDINDVIGQYEFFFFKFPLFCDNMDNFVHNVANKTSEFLQYVLVENPFLGIVLVAILDIRKFGLAW